MVINKIFGNKSVFAVQIEVEDVFSGFGKILIWLQGISIGTLADTAMLGVPLYSLGRVQECVNNEFEGKDSEDIYSLIKDGEDGGRFYLGLGDTFDDFLVVAYVSNEKVNFIWCLSDQPIFEYRNHPKGILAASVPLTEYQKVVFDCKEFLGKNTN